MALNLPFTKQLLKKASPEQEELEKLVQLDQDTRDSLIKSQAQFEVYATSVNQNLSSLKDFVKGDEEKEERLNRLIKNLSKEDLITTLKKVGKDEKVSVEAVQDLLQTVGAMKTDISHLDAGIQISMGNVVNEYKKQILNENNSTEQQMKVLNGLLSTMRKEQSMLEAEIDIYSAEDKLKMEKEQLAKLAKQEAALEKLKTQQVNLTKFARLDTVAFRDHSGEVERLLDDASDQTHRSRLLSSLTNVDNQLEQLGIDSKELAHVTKRLDGSQGKEIAGKEERGRLSDIKSTAKGGAASFILEGLGLGGLDQLFGISDKIGDFSFGGFFGKGKDKKNREDKKSYGREGKRSGGLLRKVKGMFSGGVSSIKDSEEYLGTRQALEDVSSRFSRDSSRRDSSRRDSSRRDSSRRDSSRRDRGSRFKKSKGIKGLIGKAVGGFGSLLGAGSLLGTITEGSEGSTFDTALDTADLAGEAKSAVSKKGTRKAVSKASTEGLKKAGKKAVKGSVKKIAGKGALQMGSKAAAVLGPVAAMAGAAMAGWEIGTFINKLITKKTGRSDWLFAKLTDRREAKMKAAQDKKMKEKYIPKFKKSMSKKAFALMGGEENFDITRFSRLMTSKAIVSEKDEKGKVRWVTSEEKESSKNSQKTKSLLKQESKVIETKSESIPSVSSVSGSIIDKVAEGSEGIIPSSVKSSKQLTKSVVEKSPDVLKDSTTKILEVEKNTKNILSGIAGNTAQAPNVTVQQRSEGSSTDRKLNINDSDLLFVRSVLLG